jgi:hypothetical protein
MRGEYHVVLVSDPTAVLGQIRKKICFGLKGNVLFIIYRLLPKFQCF